MGRGAFATAVRIGMIGFSAGVMLTMTTALNSDDAKPAFIGNIYGGLNAVDFPADAPPLFVAIAMHGYLEYTR